MPFFKELSLCGFFLGKNNKQKSQLNRVRRPDGGALMLCEDRARQEEKRLSPDKNSVNKNPWTLFTLPSQLPFPPECSYLPVQALGHGSLQLQTPHCNSLLIPNEHIFIGKIIGHLFKSTNYINLHTQLAFLKEGPETM